MLKRPSDPAGELARVKLDLARWKRSSAVRDAFRRGWRGGYALGRKDERDGVTIRERKPGFAGHPQVGIYGIDVDEGLAPLLSVLWRLGLETQYSCQGHPEEFVPHHPNSWAASAQIFFTDAEKGLKFIRKSMELLEPHARFHEGGFQMQVADGIDTHVPRGDVRFAPTLIAPLIDAWTEFERQLAERDRADGPVEA